MYAYAEPWLRQEADRIVRVLRGVGKITVDILPPRGIAITVVSRVVKRQVEHVLSDLDLRSDYWVETVLRGQR